MFKLLLLASKHIDKKEKKIFLIYKEIQKGAAAKQGLPNIQYKEMRKHLVVYEETFIHI
jgi:hypothetical protein